MNKDLIISKYKEFVSELVISITALGGCVVSDEYVKKVQKRESELSLLQEQEKKEPDIDVCDIVDRYWKFDEQQQHLSSWHDKQDCLKEMKRQIEKHYSLGEVYKRIGGIVPVDQSGIREELIKYQKYMNKLTDQWDLPKYDQGIIDDYLKMKD